MNLGLSLSLGGMRAGGGPAGPLDFIGYGQSNWLFHMTNQTGRPAAHPDTFVWNPDTNAWIEPVGNGIRTFLNAMQAATGRVCRLVSGGNTGVPIASLQKGAGTGFYEALLDRVVASGINPAFILYHQGEGDALGSPAPTQVGYQAALNTLHTSIVTDTGKSLSALPMVVSSLATLTDPQTAAINAQWDTIQRSHATVNAAYPNIHYSHSNVNATLVDGIHWDGHSYGRSGARYAQTVQFLQGSQSDRPRWYATAAERFSTTETDITVVGDMGTDFTPASGITGFEVTDDNGTTWEAATGERIDAGKIRLTHSNMGTVERKIRYHYGANPVVTAPALDNSALVNPLNYTTTDLVAAGAVALPVITWANSAQADSTGATQSYPAITVPGDSQELLAIVGITVNTDVGYTSVTLTAQPSNTAITATLVATHSVAQAGARIYQAVLPVGTTSVTAQTVFASSPFNRSAINVATVPTANLSSTTAVSNGSNSATGPSNVSVDISTSDGGFIFTVAVTNSTAATGTFSGDEAIATRNNRVTGGAVHTCGDVSGVATNAANTVTITFSNPGAHVRVTAASWR
jgi:hypothetical protein